MAAGCAPRRVLGVNAQCDARVPRQVAALQNTAKTGVGKQPPHCRRLVVAVLRRAVDNLPQRRQAVVAADQCQRRFKAQITALQVFVGGGDIGRITDNDVQRRRVGRGGATMPA